MQLKLALNKDDFEKWFDTLGEEAKIEFASSVRTDIVKTHIAKLIGQDSYKEIEEKVIAAIERQAVESFGTFKQRYYGEYRPIDFTPSSDFLEQYNCHVEALSLAISEKAKSDSWAAVHEYFEHSKQTHLETIEGYFEKMSDETYLDKKVSAMVDQKLSRIFGQVKPTL